MAARKKATRKPAGEPAFNRRKLTSGDVSFELLVKADENCDESSIRGSFASGDEKADREIADGIIRRLTDGDETAWCGVIVEARYGEHIGGASIWGNTLSDEYTAETVAEEHGLYSEALESLQREVDAADYKKAGQAVLSEFESIPEATLRSWIKRGFSTVEPLARLELARRALKP